MKTSPLLAQTSPSQMKERRLYSTPLFPTILA